MIVAGMYVPMCWPVRGDDKSFLQLAPMRRVELGEFRGKWRIDIREMYNDKATGEERPGKKGISIAPLCVSITHSSLQV